MAETGSGGLLAATVAAWRRCVYRAAGGGLARPGPTRRWALLAVAVAAFLPGASLLGNGARAEDRLGLGPELTDDRLVRNFDIVVFRNEFDSTIDSQLRKWVDPVRIYLDIRAGDPALIRELTGRHVRRLARITGHDIALIEDRADANMTIVFEQARRLVDVGSDYFSNDFDIRTVMRTNLCFGRYHSNGDHEIFKSVIVIPTDRARSRGKLAACIIEETTQVLGLPNDSEELIPSIFNDKSADEDLTAQDVVLIRLLYDPRIRAGMARPEVLRRVRAILGEMRE